MPASSTDLIEAALFSAFSRKASNQCDDNPYFNIDETQHFPSLKQASLVEYDLTSFHKKQQLNFGSCSFDILQLKYGTLKQNKPINKLSGFSKKKLNMAHSGNEDKLEEPKTVLWSHDKVLLGWRKNFPPGAGMINLGNTCYMNSSLQALFHIPSLANWLLDEASSHMSSCESNTYNASFCSICGMMRTLKQALDRGNSHIRPTHIHNKLKCIGKTLIYGRQEDAHEFIKLLLDHMEKSFLTFMNATKLDHRSKETTPLNQIFGGYLRQQVICPLCGYVSTTFSHFQDLVLDIRAAGSLEDALRLYFRKETLDSDNAYKCENCHKKVPATKRHLIEKAPHVLLLQLKRFTVSGGKITRHINIDKILDLSRYVNGVKTSLGNNTGLYCYKLVSMVIHIGGSQHGGHYTAVAEATNNTMFEYDDSSVRSISMQSALLRNPYILFYEMVQRPKTSINLKKVMRQSSEKVLLKQNTCENIQKPLPTSFSTNCIPKHPNDIGEVVSRKGHSSFKSSPLVNIKDRDKVSFGIKLGKKGPIDKNVKIGINSSTSNYTQQSGSSLKFTNNHHTKISRPSSSLVPYNADSDDSGEENGLKKHINGHHKSDEDKNESDSNNGSTINCKIQKSFCNNISNGESHFKPITFLPRTLQLPSDNRSNITKDSNCNGHSNLTNGLLCDKNKPVLLKLECSSNKNSPVNELLLVNGCNSQNNFINEKSKLKFNMKKEDNSKNQNIGSSSSMPKPKLDLEKSLSNDSILPIKSSNALDKIDSASLKSKESLDSNKSSRSMKKSLFSLFPCIASTRLDLSPEHRKMNSVDKINSSPIKEDPKRIHNSYNEPDKIPENYCLNGVSESYFSKRNRDCDEQEPTSPSKKCKPVDKFQSSDNKCVLQLKCFKSKCNKDAKSNNCINHENEKTYSIAPSPNFAKDRILNNGSVKEQNFCMEDKKSRHKRKGNIWYDSEESDGSNNQNDSGNPNKRTILNPNSVEIPWNKNIKDLRYRMSPQNLKSFDGNSSNLFIQNYTSEMISRSKPSSVVAELKRAGDYSFGSKVETWEGSLSLLDSETQKARNEARKRTADEIYNEEFDAGKVPKKRHKTFEHEEQPSKENPFQKYQNTHYSQLRGFDRTKPWEGANPSNFKPHHNKHGFNNKKNHSRSWNSNSRPFFNKNFSRSNSYGSKPWKQKSRNSSYHDNFNC